MSRKIVIVSLLFVAVIVVLAFGFHYQVFVENALTLQPEPGFEIKFNFWRSLFEPFLGVLLFFNRSFYAIAELIQTLYWLLLIFTGYTVVKIFMLKESRIRKQFLLQQVVNLPIIVGVWFVLFVVVIFIALPNDRIVNNTKNLVLVNTHSHTEFSHDGLISQEGLWKWHKRNGFDAFFITEHNNHNRSLEFVNRQRNNEFPGEPAVFCGEEFSGSNHLSLLGLKTNFTTKGLSDSVVVAKARSEGAAIIVNHWFDGERKTLEYYRDLGSDGFEIENTATDKRYDREVYHRIKSFCETNGLIMNGALDFHGYGSACTLWNAFEIPGWKNLDFIAKEQALLDIIKNRDQNKLKVLLLNDRPYYEKENLFFRPAITLFYYFRTLGFMQLVSWIVWIFLFVFIFNKVNSNPALKKKLICRKVFPLAGMVASVFLIGLGMVYVLRIQHVEEFTEIYLEYSRILFVAGGAMLVFSGVAAWLSIFRKHKS